MSSDKFLDTDTELGALMLNHEQELPYQQYLLYDIEYLKRVIAYLSRVMQINTNLTNVLIIPQKDIVHMRYLLRKVFPSFYRRFRVFANGKLVVDPKESETDSQLRPQIHFATTDMGIKEMLPRWTPQNSVVVLEDTVLEMDKESELIESSEANKIVMAADTVLVADAGRTIREWVQSIKGIKTKVWWCFSNTELLFTKNVVSDFVKMGQYLQDRKFMDMSYIKEHSSIDVIDRLKKDKVVQSAHIRIPLSQIKFKKIRVRNERVQLANKLMETYYRTRVLPFFQNMTARKMILHDYNMIRPNKSSWKRLNQQYKIVVNEMYQFLRAYELLFYYPKVALQNMIENVTSSSTAFNTLVQKIYEEISDDKVISRKVSKIFNVIDDCLRYGRMDKMSLIIVPSQLDMFIFEKTAFQKLLRQPVENLDRRVFFFNKKNETTETLMKKMTKRQYRFHRVLVMEERDFRTFMPSGCEWIKEELEAIHIFPLKYAYSPIAQHKLYGLFKRDATPSPYNNAAVSRYYEFPDITIYYGTTDYENHLVTHFLQRKTLVSQEMNHEPEKWLSLKRSKAIPKSFHLIKDTNVPLYEKQATTYYDTEELTPMEMLKCLSLGTTKGSHNNIPYIQRTVTEGIRLFPDLFSDEPLLSPTVTMKIQEQIGAGGDWDWTQIFYSQGILVDYGDIRACIQMLYFLRNRKDDDAIKLIIVLLAIVDAYFAGLMKKFMQKRNKDIDTRKSNNVRRALSSIRDVAPLLVAAVNILSKRGDAIQKWCDRVRYQVGQVYPEKLDVRSLRDYPKFDDRDLRFWIENNLKNPLLLVYFAHKMEDTDIGKKMFLQRLVDWLTLYGEQLDIQAQANVIKEAVLVLSSDVAGIFGKSTNRIKWF